MTVSLTTTPKIANVNIVSFSKAKANTVRTAVRGQFVVVRINAQRL